MNDLIRPLRPDEAELYRDIRLEALRLHPEAFGADFESEANDLTFFRQRLTSNVVFGGFRGNAVLGVVGFMPQGGAKRAHKGTLWGMYVRAEARGSGLSRLLAEAVLAHGQDYVELIQLSVAAENVPARRLYAALGFEPYGVEARALKVDGRYVDEVLMVKMLR
ncbi:GNAT family N-acetyltransferase [Acidisphaera sp. S103]|uniref:GNAT family N-acetyltransferase n=1 Tax=Acidisphaera sp. S103 TaxID=1747223 RepID=UPI00131CBEC5|nr:GNAT family N-acetyltransferase [Acidisphaera sp. S103]